MVHLYLEDAELDAKTQEKDLLLAALDSVYPTSPGPAVQALLR
jgi:hypothetical protein